MGALVWTRFAGNSCRCRWWTARFYRAILDLGGAHALAARLLHWVRATAPAPVPCDGAPKGLPMNPAPGIAADNLTLWSLFYNADIMVKLVMVGLIIASVWVWAIVDRQGPAVQSHAARHGPLRAGVLVGPVAGGTLQVAVVAADAFDGRAVRRGHARMEAQPGRPGALVHRPADAHREGDGRHHRARGRAAGAQAAGAGDRRFRRPLRRACSEPCGAS